MVTVRGQKLDRPMASLLPCLVPRAGMHCIAGRWLVQVSRSLWLTCAPLQPRELRAYMAASFCLEGVSQETGNGSCQCIEGWV